MESDLDTKKIRRKVYISYFQDGMWDIVLGLFLLGWGFAIMFDLGWLPGATFVAFFWIALGLKQKITYPRIGFSRPDEQRRQMSRFVIAGAVALLLGVMVFLIAVTGEMPQLLKDYFELFFGTMLALVVGLIGYWWGIVRWYLYAALMFVLAVCNQWSELSFELSFIIPGAIIFFYGLIIFIQFLRKYPAVPEGDFDGDR